MNLVGSSTDDQFAGRLAISIPEAGALIGISKNSAYEAAQRGQLPTVRFGRRLLVPLPALCKMFGISGDALSHGRSIKGAQIEETPSPDRSG